MMSKFISLEEYLDTSPDLSEIGFVDGCSFYDNPDPEPYTEEQAHHNYKAHQTDKWANKYPKKGRRR